MAFSPWPTPLSVKQKTQHSSVAWPANQPDIQPQSNHITLPTGPKSHHRCGLELDCRCVFMDAGKSLSHIKKTFIVILYLLLHTVYLANNKIQHSCIIPHFTQCSLHICRPLLGYSFAQLLHNRVYEMLVYCFFFLHNFCSCFSYIFF